MKQLWQNCQFHTLQNSQNTQKIKNTSNKTSSGRFPKRTLKYEKKERRRSWGKHLKRRMDSVS
jgi:hypothetical protein